MTTPESLAQLHATIATSGKRAEAKRGPVLFYASPVSFFTFESHFVCPWCPYVDAAYSTRIIWIAGLGFALFSGSVLAAVGFGIAYGVSKAFT
jgi:hypothetical protein